VSLQNDSCSLDYEPSFSALESQIERNNCGQISNGKTQILFKFHFPVEIKMVTIWNKISCPLPHKVHFNQCMRQNEPHNSIRMNGITNKWRPVPVSNNKLKKTFKKLSKKCINSIPTPNKTLKKIKEKNQRKM